MEEQQPYFPALESNSNRPDDREQGIQYQSPVTVSGADDASNLSQPLGNLQRAPVQATSDGNRAQEPVYTARGIATVCKTS